MSLFKKADGTFTDVPDESVQAAHDAGWTPATEAEYEASKHPIQTGVESAVGKGLGLGFLTPVVRNVESLWSGKSREQVSNEMRAREEANPTADIVGQVAGGVGATLLTGGGAAEVLGAKTAVGRIGAGALEGSLNGIGAEVTESTLENRPVQAEKLALGGGIGLVTGLGAGAMFEGVKKGTSFAMKATGAKSVSQALQKAAEDAEWQAVVGAETPGQRQALEPFKARILKFARDNKALGFGMSGSEENVARIASKVQEVGKKVESQWETLDSVSPLKDPAQRDVFAAQVEKALDDKFGGNSMYDDALKEIGGKLDSFVEKGSRPNARGWKDVFEMQKSLYDGLMPTDPSVRREVFEATRRAMREAALKEAERLNPGQAAAMKAAAEEYAAGNSVLDALKRKAADVKDLPGVVGGAATGGALGAAVGHPLAGALAGGAKAFGSQVAESRGGYIQAAALRAVADSSILSGATKGLAGRIAQVLSVAPAALGTAGPILERALARGDDELLAEHSRLANGPGGDKYLATLGYSKETPQQMQDLSGRMSVYGAITANTKMVDSSIDRAVDGFFGAKPGPKSVSVSSMGPKDYAKLMGNIEGILKSPENAYAAIPSEFLAAAPATTAEAMTAHLNALKFLKDKAPKDPNAGLPAALRAPWEPSRADLDRWNRYVEAVSAPQKVLEQMGKGLMSKEYVEGLQMAYPQVYEEMKQKMTMRLMEWKKPLSYEKRLGLSYVLGPQALNMTPQQIGVIQTTFQKQGNAGNAPQGGGKSPDGRQTVNQNKSIQTQNQTQAQRLEER